MIDKPKITPRKKFDYSDTDKASKGLTGNGDYVERGAETRMKAVEVQSSINDINKKRAEGKLDG